MKPDVFLSLLALDAYNRGYGRGVFANGSATDENEIGRRIGNVTVLNDTNDPEGVAEEAGFYAIAYDLSGETIISYRGTNFPNDILAPTEAELVAITADFLGGWSLFTGLEFPVQIDFARDFLISTTGTGFTGVDPISGSSNITLTGHSLGGALAGYVGARSGLKTVAFDPIPFGSATNTQVANEAYAKTLSDLGLQDATLAEYLAFFVDIGSFIPTTFLTVATEEPEPVGFQLFFETLDQNLALLSPDFSVVEGYYLEGEIAASISSLQMLSPALAATLAPIISIVSAPAAVTLTALTIDQFFEGLSDSFSGDRDGIVQVDNRDVGGLLDTVDLHSQSLLTILLYGQEQWRADGGDAGSPWEASIKYITPAITDNDIAEDLGLSTGESGTGLSSPGSQLAAMIAYSLINEGTRVFGDTGIRSLFADADRLGKTIEAVPQALDEETLELFGSTIAEFAGLLASNKVLAEGNARASGGITASSQESGSAIGLITDPGYWAEVGDEEGFSSRNANALLTKLFDEQVVSSEKGGATASVELKKWLSQAATRLGLSYSPLTPLDEIIDSVTLTFEGGSLARTSVPSDQPGFDVLLGLDRNNSDGTNTGRYNNTLTSRNEIAVGGNGGNTLIGGGGDDALIGGAIADTLNGGAGNDLIAGGGGADTLTGGAGDDIIWSGQLGNQLDSAAGDVLTGGSGKDTFYAGTGDTITDPGNGDRIYLNGQRLTGGKETEEGSQIYEGDGGQFTVADDGTLTFTRNPTITIQNFRNGEAGIRLIPEEPDDDEAEELRDPLVIDLDGDRNVVTTLNNSSAYFDLDNDGFAERVAWARASDGFLVRDLDGNGTIDTGAEMFGTGNVDTSGGRFQAFGEDGFAELALLDSNLDGAITAADAQFSELKVWIDANLDAFTDNGELVTLESLGIVSISLSTFGADHVNIVDDESIIARASLVEFDNGDTATVYDAYLAIDQYDARENLNDFVVDERVSDLPFLIGTGELSDLDVAMTRDPGLAELVRAFSELDVSRAQEILSLTQQILLRWTGADQIAEDSRGPNINAQWLRAIETITGSDFNQAQIGPNPRGDAGSILINEWRDIVSRKTAELAGQTALGEALTPGLSFVSAAFFRAQDGATLENVLASVVAQQPESPSDKISYWTSIIAVLDQYRNSLGVSELALDTTIEAELEAAGIDIGVAALRDAIVLAPDEDFVIGRGSPLGGETDDVFLINGDGGDVQGGAGNDLYVVNAAKGLDIRDVRGTDTLYLADYDQADIQVSAIVEEGETWLRVTDNQGSLALRIALEIRPNSVEADVQRIQFADGEPIDILSLVSPSDVGGTVVFGGARPFVISGTSQDELLTGFGGDNEYAFGPGSGSDTVADANGDDDLIRINANQADVSFSIARDGLFDDVLVTIDATGETLRIVGQHSTIDRAIESLIFNDGTLTQAELDRILTAGTDGVDEILGSARGDVIEGLAGDDTLKGGLGRDEYRFELGWGEDRVIDGDVGNEVVFGETVSVSDISYEAGANGDLVLRSSLGDRLTIVGGLRSAVANTFAFADGTVTPLLDVIDLVSALDSATIAGTAADDVLTGSLSSETFVGNGGSDVFNGGGGSDRYLIGDGFTRVNGSSNGVDIIVAPTGVDLFDLRFDDDSDIFEFGRGGPIVDANSRIDFVLFADGFTIDLNGPGLTAGTSGNDFLYSTAEPGTVFRPGAGDDVMIGSTSESVFDRYEFEVGFGNDTIYDLGGRDDRVTFLSPELSVDNATFEKIDNDLVISFTSGDRLTIEGHYWNHPYESGIPFFGQDTGNIEVFRFGDGRAFVGVNGFISSQTDGDDIVMFPAPNGRSGDRIGDAGDDTLIGGSERNFYVVRAGEGNELIKDSGGSRDQVRYFGVEFEDVSIARDPTDPYTIVFTNTTNGETLTIDGTPDDGFRPDADPRSELRSRGLQIEEFIFDSSTVEDFEIVSAIFAADATDGDDVIIGLNSDGFINGGRGNDRIEIGFGRETVSIDQEGGHDIVTFEGDGSQSGFGGSPFFISFEGISVDDLVLVEINEVDGVVGRHLQIIGGSSSVTILNGLDSRVNAIFGEGGTTARFEIEADDGSLFFENPIDPFGPPVIPLGRVTPLTQGTGGNDVLQGDGRSNTIIDPGAGDDVIFGSPSRESVRFDVGYGSNRYEWQGGRLDVVMGAGLTSADIELTWLQDEPGLIELSLRGSGDKLVLDAQALATIVFENETLSVDLDEGVDPATLPTRFVDPDDALTSQPGDERIIATGGSASIAIALNSGLDFVSDARFDAAVDGTDSLVDWSANQLRIEGPNDISELRFVIEDDNPSDLIIETLSGDRITIANQFAFGIPTTEDGWVSPDIDGDGLVQWTRLDLNRDGAPDFSRLDADADGQPDFAAVDFDGDGLSDWRDTSFAFVSVGNTFIDAEDADGDGNFELYYVDTDEIFYTLRDVDGDGVADQYSLDDVTFISAPTDAGGNTDWSLLDLDGNGVSDLAGFADGTGPTWLSEWSPGDNVEGWEIFSSGRLDDADGRFLAEREFDFDTGITTYTLYPPSPFFTDPADQGVIFSEDTFLARDLDNDGVIDEVAVAQVFGDEPRPIADPQIQTVIGSIVIGSSPFSERAISLAEIVEQLEFVTPKATTFLDLEALRPSPSDGSESLLLGTGEEIDSLAGDDVITSFGDGGVFRWSSGDGNDVFRSTLRFPASANEPFAEGGTALDTVRFDGINSPNQLRFFASENDPADLVVEIAETGERLTIEGQLGAKAGRAEGAPPVGLFVFESGFELTAGQIALSVQGGADIGDDVQRTDDTGGLLDGGADGAANNMLVGGTGDDIYRFGRDYAEDTIMDAGGGDTVQFGEGITADDLFFSRTGDNGDDLLIEVLGLDRLTLTITGQFGNRENQIETFSFADGSRLRAEDVQQIILDLAETRGDDTIVGFASNDIVRGGEGNDSLTGSGGDDRIFGGEGRDQAVFSGASSEYVVTVDGDVTTVTDTVADRDGKTLLESVEDLLFLGDSSTTELVPANIAPIVNDLQFAMSEDGTLTIERATLIASASDANGDELDLRVVENAVNGQVWIGSDGDVRFRPDTDFAGEASFAFSITDGNGAVTTATAIVAVAGLNDAPSIAIEDRRFSALEDTAVDWLLPAGAIFDPDGDPLAVEAVLASGDPLPSWLSFDGERFTGTPPTDFNGLLDIQLLADDGTVATTSDLQIEIVAINDAPRVAVELDDVLLSSGSTFSVDVPAVSFVDPEGDTINFDIVAGDGSPLPDWIVVDGLNISGTVPAGFSDPVEIAVIADDGRAANVASFSVMPETNSAPTVTAPLSDVRSEEDASFTFSVSDSFEDSDGDPLTLTAALSDGSDLPAWVNFENGIFNGTPPQDFNGFIDLLVTASDGTSSVSDTFRLTIDAVNDAPIVVESLSDQSGRQGRFITLVVPGDSFADVDGDTLSYSASFADGSALPEWLTFDEQTLTFSGTPPTGLTGNLDLAVTASDGELSAQSTFTLSVAAGGDYTIFRQDIASSVFSVELVDGEPTYLVDGNAVAGLNAFLDTAVTSLGGEREKSGSIQEKALEHFGDSTNPAIRQSVSGAETDVIISGAGVGGQYRAGFADPANASVFEAFANDLLGRDPAQNKVFEFVGNTNGGSNSIRIFENDEITALNGDGFITVDSYLFEWSGADTAGTQRTTDHDTFIERMGELFGGVQESDADLFGFFGTTQANLTGVQSDKVTIAGVGADGAETWVFGSQSGAETFRDFFESLGLIAQVSSQSSALSMSSLSSAVSFSANHGVQSVSSVSEPTGGGDAQLLSEMREANYSSSSLFGPFTVGDLAEMLQTQDTAAISELFDRFDTQRIGHYLATSQFRDDTRIESRDRQPTSQRMHVMPEQKVRIVDLNGAAPIREQEGSAEMELSRKLMMIRQDMAAFGSGGGVEAGRIYEDRARYMDLFA